MDDHRTLLMSMALAKKSGGGSGGNAYVKPETGIPESDLSAGVREKLNAGGGSGVSEPHNFAFDGKNLQDSFADADALWAALSQEDYTNIRIGDYWPVTLNGDYWDY